MALDEEQFAGLAGFRLALRRFVAASEAINREDIKTRTAEAMPMKELAEQLLLTHHAAVQLVNRLAKAGLAARSPSNEDRRSVLLTLTPAGEGLLDVLAGKHLEEMQRQEPLLTRSLRRLKQIAPADSL
jgi:DNA-binding MarR family transcriptional regulator